MTKIIRNSNQQLPEKEQHEQRNNVSIDKTVRNRIIGCTLRVI